MREWVNKQLEEDEILIECLKLFFVHFKMADIMASFYPDGDDLGQREN